MGKPNPQTADRSCSGAIVRKIIRRVHMGNIKEGVPPKQKKYNNASNVILFNKWRVATQNSCNVSTATNPRHNNCVPDGKRIGPCGC